jgi:hypothetical protein
VSDYRNWRWSCPCGFAHVSRGYLAEDIEEAMETPTKCPNCGRDMAAPRVLDETDAA